MHESESINQSVSQSSSQCDSRMFDLFCKFLSSFLAFDLLEWLGGESYLAGVFDSFQTN
jgi:hypothetical protein